MTIEVCLYSLFITLFIYSAILLINALLLSRCYPRFHSLFSVISRQHSVDPDDPPRSAISLLKVLQIVAFLADFAVPCRVVSEWLPVGGPDLAESVVAESVHQAIEHGLGGVVIHSVYAVVVVVCLLYLGVHSGGDADHPQELRDVVAGVG